MLTSLKSEEMPKQVYKCFIIQRFTIISAEHLLLVVFVKMETLATKAISYKFHIRMNNGLRMPIPNTDCNKD